MTIKNWIDILVPMIGILGSIISASITYFFTKKQQINAEERRIKQEYFLNYIKVISDYAISNDRENKIYDVADVANNLSSIASSEVVRDAQAFHEYMRTPRKDYSIQKQDELYTTLVKSMRKDLYKKSNINSGYPTLKILVPGK